MEKLSHFGGTAGLFNGFTIICIFELLAFVLTLIINCFKNKKKGSNLVKVEEFKKNENKKESFDIKEKLEDNMKIFEYLRQELMINRLDITDENQKFETMEREFVLKRHRIDEDGQKLNAMDTELIVKRYQMDEDRKKIENVKSELNKMVDAHILKKKYQ